MEPEGAMNEKSLTKINLKGAFGPSTVAYLISIEAKLIEEDDKEDENGGAYIVCAVSKELNGNVILLSPADYDILKRSNNRLKSQNNIIANTSLLAEKPNAKENELQEASRMWT